MIPPKHFQDGHNVYAFCSSRRDVDIIADEFESENPVIYNAYTKGERACRCGLEKSKTYRFTLCLSLHLPLGWVFLYWTRKPTQLSLADSYMAHVKRICWFKNMYEIAVGAAVTSIILTTSFLYRCIPKRMKK